jgi:hypothetical protein
MRRFDPRAVGRYECRAWETYYRRKWAAFLIASVLEWWRAHRENQYGDHALGRALLVRSYAALLGAVYR